MDWVLCLPKRSSEILLFLDMPLVNTLPLQSYADGQNTHTARTSLRSHLRATRIYSRLSPRHVPTFADIRCMASTSYTETPAETICQTSIADKMTPTSPVDIRWIEWLLSHYEKRVEARQPSVICLWSSAIFNTLTDKVDPEAKARFSWYSIVPARQPPIALLVGLL